MCGIAGLWMQDRPTGERESKVELMCARLRARGPDGEGLWSDTAAGLTLGHRRLSIIDLDARASQPMLSASGQFVVVFNGEIYNYRDLSAELEARQVHLRTTSDTEVLLELLARDGIDAVRRLRGMFAFALWDRAARALHLVRDPYGIKPLYVAETGNNVAFASQVKALVASGLTGDRDPAALAAFFLTGSVPEPLTLFRNVRAVPAGSIVTVRGGKVGRPQHYNDIAEAWSDRVERRRPEEVAEQVHAALADSIHYHLVADVPVSVFLSGGVDSGTVAGMMSAETDAVEGVTVGFAEFGRTREDEVPRARQLARHYGLMHTVRTIDRAEFEADLPRILDAMDQPSIDGVNSWFASKAVAERGYKVVLSGIGGDELLCGYQSFQDVPRLVALSRWAAALSGPVARAGFALAARTAGKPKLAAIPAFATTPAGAHFLARAVFLPGDLPALMHPDAAREGLASLDEFVSGDARIGDRGAPADIARLESVRYLRNQLLRDSDWASMAHSLELRTPFVDFELLRQLAPYTDSFANGAGKRILASAPRPPLPNEIVDRPKTGFSLPIGRWLTESPVADHWKRIATLRPATTQWARRWAYVVAHDFTPELTA